LAGDRRGCGDWNCHNHFRRPRRAVVKIVSELLVAILVVESKSPQNLSAVICVESNQHGILRFFISAS
jgi:hypothetical protein